METRTWESSLTWRSSSSRERNCKQGSCLLGKGLRVSWDSSKTSMPSVSCWSMDRKIGTYIQG